MPEYSYSTKWEQFARLTHTQDSLAEERRGLGRWLLLPYVTFMIPVEDEAAVAPIIAWQRALSPWLHYDPLPPDQLHITLHHVGRLRVHPWLLLPHLWSRVALPKLAERVRPTVEAFPQFEVKIGPLNAFPNALVAEVQDDQQCLHLLRARLRRALPLRARPTPRWSFLPHVTLGYWGEQDIMPLVEAIRPYRQIAPFTMRVTRVKLTIYSRHHAPLGRHLLHAAHEEVIADYRLKEPPSGH